MILEVEVSMPNSPLTYEKFYTSLRKDFRITIPRVYADALELELGQLVNVQIKIPEDNLEKTIFRSMKKVQVSTGRGIFAGRN